MSSEDNNNLYKFEPTDWTTTRLRRVEKTVPYLNRGVNVVSKAISRSIDSTAINNAGQVTLASSAVVKKGSTPPNGVSGNFGAAATTTSITWYWDGTNSSNPLVIHRSDGSSFSVPRGSITISGLTANTTYYFLPFWSVTGGCQIGWVLGTTGTPQIAFVLADTNVSTTQQYLIQQQLQNREPLTNGFMTFATPSAGTGGGTGGGGGQPGNCVMTGTDIDPIGDADVTIGIHHQRDWWNIVTTSGRGLSGTPNHPIYVVDPEDKEKAEAVISEFGYSEEHLDPWKMQMQDAERGYLVITRDGLEVIERSDPFTRNCTKRSVHMSHGHLYWANGFLSHNMKPDPPA